MVESKADRILLNHFVFDRKPKSYLLELPFVEARVIFMLRSRMFSTKENFKGRWNTECAFCHKIESDVYLFSCAEYNDLLKGVSFKMFI